ncbi:MULTISPECIES: alanine--tRNA ligase [unclassified Streptomyces]|uniref:alanine--tRNA ligase n=1 Tax=unclassified Streptomyces TaxID=2593676 RepID=UPI00343A7A7D
MKHIDSPGQLRTSYLDFFAARGHAVIPSASLVPDRDPSVLFTTAGMHPLVPYFLGAEHPAGTRLVDYQKCVRTNDIEEVGDPTHLTFFEMLGNWSLGDYFKQDSIRWSHEFLVREDCLAIDPDRLWVTVFAGNDSVPRDEESAALWRSLGIAEDHIVFLPEEHNWWAAGPEGPCGPDTEIFVDLTGTRCPDEDAATCLPGLCGNARFFEIWNNVFMTFDRRDGVIRPLPRRNVDTGMGLERTIAVLNGAATVYETPCFAPIIEALVGKGAYSPEEIRSDAKLTRALRILSDHLRTSVFILGDRGQVSPGNQGAGYVLRRLIRRAVRYTQHLGVKASDWVATADVVVDMYGEAYPELVENRGRILAELAKEQQRFAQTIERGTARLSHALAELRQSGGDTLPGDVAFQLYDTFGFPLEFTVEIAAESGVGVDTDAYRRQFALHQERSRSQAAKSGLADDSEESTRYHTATHLLHAALREVLGPHALQKGSNITKDRLRFDFSHPTAMTPEEIRRVEDLVRSWIGERIEVTHSVMPQAEARSEGAIGVFDEKYDGTVSVYRIGERSLEFCGGPHVRNTGELGHFRIVKEQSSGAGVRRIRAVLA